MIILVSQAIWWALQTENFYETYENGKEENSNTTILWHKSHDVEQN